LIIKQLQIVSAFFYKGDDIGEYLVCVTGIVAQAADPQCKPLPQVIVVRLSHGDVELIVDPCYYRSGNLTLGLETLAVR